MRFTKMHGAGNDFIVLDRRDGAPPPDPLLASRLADRHLGVGCDQILTIEAPHSDQAIASYRIWNADGSRAQQCGNGARCVAAWIQRDLAFSETRFRLDSPAGPIEVQVHDDGSYALDMGVPVFDAARIPLKPGLQAPFVFDWQGFPHRIYAASMGNPHALLRVEDIERAAVPRFGKDLQDSGLFPEGVNVGFAEIRSPQAIHLRVFERGVGETLACGSGACAAVAMLVRDGLVAREVDVHLPGGVLRISWPADDAGIIMRGPAAFVFEGEWRDE